jgi:hypothetical protein
MNSPEHAKFLTTEWLESWADSGLEWKYFPTSRLMAHLAASAMAPAEPAVEPAIAPPFEAAPEVAPVAATLAVIFVVRAEPSAPGLALLARMVSAMGIDSTNVGLVAAEDPQTVRSLSNWNDFRPAQAKAWVGLGAAHDLLTLDLQTYSLDEVLANPTLKKPVWEGLQKIMHKLGLR